MAEDRLIRQEFVRPIVLAIFFTLAGEILIFLLWGVVLFPAGTLWRKLAWTMVCGLAMGATIGALVNVFVTGRQSGRPAGIAAGALYFGVLSLCVLICYEIDHAIGFFGAHEEPLLFILGGLVPAAITAVAYGWLLHAENGRAILSRCGL